MPIFSLCPYVRGSRLTESSPESKSWERVSSVQEFGYTIETQITTAHGRCSSSRSLYNQQWISVLTVNELQFPECWYPESWKGLEWHLLNPGAQILATAQSSEFSTGVKDHNKCSFSGLLKTAWVSEETAQWCRTFAIWFNQVAWGVIDKSDIYFSSCCH